MSRRTVLIVDDELNLLRALRDAVRARDWDVDVLTAGNAEEALELMALKEVDVVVTDVRMPGIDGLKLIEQVRETYPRSRCLVMTAHVDAGSEAAAKRLGAVSFIKKPFELEAFLGEVEARLSPRGFRGTSLMGFSLPDILQLVAMNGQGLTFEVVSGESDSGGKRGTLVVEGGLLLAAKTDELTGVEAAYDILSWEAGEITSRREVDAVLDVDERLGLSLTEVLMNAASRFDEDSRNMNGVASSTTVDDLVRVIEEVEREVRGFLGSIVCSVDGAEELAGVKARAGFPREWLRKQIPRVCRLFAALTQEQADVEHALEQPVRRLVVELDELSIVALAVGGGSHLWIGAVRRGGALEALELAMERLRGELTERVGGASSLELSASALI